MRPEMRMDAAADVMGSIANVDGTGAKVIGASVKVIGMVNVEKIGLEWLIIPANRSRF